MKLAATLVALLCAASAQAQSSDEDRLFGGGQPAPSAAAVDGGGAGAMVDGGGATPPVVKALSDGGFTPAPGSEDAVFGGGTTAPPSPSNPGTQAADQTENDQRRSESEILGDPSARTATASGTEVAPDNPLAVGGTLYLRTQTSAYDSTPPKDWGWSMPNLLDVYFDGRPNQRVRGFVVGRLTYDPTIDPNRPSFNGVQLSQTRTLLDQLWINFDVERTVFVTAGKQHVKWGTGRFWNPTDFLQPVKLDPLAVFDERTGVTMLKAHVPWEAKGWNFYGFALFEGAHPVSTVQDLGGAARAELVLGPAEVGLDTLVQRGRKPRFGADISSGVGPFDLYGELALHGAEGPQLRHKQNIDPSNIHGFGDLFEYQEVTGVQPQATVGGSWDVNINDRDAITVGGEFFYNALGTDDSTLYPALILTGQFTPFYVGKEYGGLYGLLLLPRGQVVNTFLLSTLSNLSDNSYITRLDYNVTVLTHLRVEFYGDLHYGTQGGEFRFGINTAGIPTGTGQIAPIRVPTPLFDAGIALRVSI